jgi:hypothetical protein
MRLRAFVLVCSLAAATAGCAGGGDEEAQPPATTTAPATTTTDANGGGAPPVSAEYGSATAAPGDALLQFVRAASRGQVERMWNLLSEPTQASVGPTVQDFASGVANQFREGVGSLANTARVVLSRKLHDDWGVAAVTGNRTVNGEEEFFAYGTALVQENGLWKLELGGLVTNQLRPDPLSEVDSLPKVGISIGAADAIASTLMWLDGKPFPARPIDETTFTVKLEGEPATELAPGEHVVVAFAATDLTATAVGWTFNVE